MKYTVLVALGATALLTACGGGSDSSPINNVSSVQTPSPTPTPTPTPTTNNSIQGNIMSVASGKANANTTTSSSAINKVVINGSEVDFYPAGFSSNTLMLMASNMQRVGGSSNLAYTRYGYIREGASGTPHLFAQGQVTTTMPTTGTATYQGNAAHLENGSVSLVGAKFNVDYGQKTLTGTVGTRDLSATISGNTFSGANNGLSTTGRFYGTNAAELGGTYKNGDGSIAGAYGAKK